MWYVYVVACFDDSLYCGITTDVNRRIKQHNGDISGGSKYTRSRRPVKLVWSVDVADRSEASKVEYKIKRLSKLKKEKLVSKVHNIFDLFPNFKPG